MGGVAEKAKKQEQSFMRKKQKERYLKSLPLVDNFCDVSIIDLHSSGFTLEDAKIYLIDLLEDEETEYETKLLRTKNKGSRILVNEIECPICQKKIKLDTKWDCFICNCNGTHEKKIFELVNIKFEGWKKDDSSS